MGESHYGFSLGIDEGFYSLAILQFIHRSILLQLIVHESLHRCLGAPFQNAATGFMSRRVYELVGGVTSPNASSAIAHMWLYSFQPHLHI